ncbi:MAG: SpoIIIAH-like family protein [Clostridia bacterium]|nr:SpoIIIAH-like family protein [Clostridia bacterium]
MNKLGRRALTALAMAVALAADTLVTLKLSSNGVFRAAAAPVVAEQTQQDPISRFRLERQQLRARQEAQLNEIIYSSQSAPEIVANAQRRLMELLQCAEQELTLEGVLEARGFEGALVTVHENSANVLLRGQTLTQRQTAVILELVLRETGLTAGSVKIIPVK